MTVKMNMYSGILFPIILKKRPRRTMLKALAPRGEETRALRSLDVRRAVKRASESRH